MLANVANSRRVRTRRRALALAVALLVHVGLVLAVLQSRTPDIAPSRPLLVELSPPWVVRDRRPAATSRSTARPRADLASQSSEPKPLEGVPTVAAPALPSPTVAASVEPNTDALAQALRSRFGCRDAVLANLLATERAGCRDALAKAGGGQFGVDPAKLAAFDAGARRADLLKQPFLAEKPKNGCRPFVTHGDHAVAGREDSDWTIRMACAVSF
ncbi:MAG TPA: hypothetical protein VGI95_07190 [Caulobacteraceae bacterium]